MQEKCFHNAKSTNPDYIPCKEPAMVGSQFCEEHSAVARNNAHRKPGSGGRTAKHAFVPNMPSEAEPDPHFVPPAWLRDPSLLPKSPPGRPAPTFPSTFKSDSLAAAKPSRATKAKRKRAINDPRLSKRPSRKAADAR